MQEKSIDDRMKMYETVASIERLMPLLPIIARLDGRSFHNFTKGLKRPYDEGLSQLMIECTDYLVKQTGANCGYTQSDEITLGWAADDFKSSVFFDRRISKMISILSAMLSVQFNKRLPEFLPAEYAERLPLFDCRIWCAPNHIEGANAFLWREQDATKNSISMAASAYYSHKELLNKNGKVKQEMLFQKGINWNDYPAFFKRGTFIQKRKVERKLLIEEINELPPKHKARLNPDLIIERTSYVKLEMPPFSKVTNRPEVIFYGANPRVD